MKTRLLAIDQGSKACGVAYLDGDDVLEVDVFRPRSTLPWAERMDYIVAQLEITAKTHRWQPDVVAVESVVVWRNAKVALVMGETRGYLFRAIRQLFPGARLMNISPSETKGAVGAGKTRDAAKLRTQLVAGAMTGRRDLAEDEADAIAIAWAAIAKLRTEAFARAAVEPEQPQLKEAR